MLRKDEARQETEKKTVAELQKQSKQMLRSPIPQKKPNPLPHTVTVKQEEGEGAEGICRNLRSHEKVPQTSPEKGKKLRRLKRRNGNLRRKSLRVCVLLELISPAGACSYFQNTHSFGTDESFFVVVGWINHCYRVLPQNMK